MRVELLTSDDCPHVEQTMERLGAVLGRLAPGATVTRRSLDGAVGQTWHHLGSPTVLVKGRDLEGRQALPRVRGCRSYDGTGVPPEWLIEAAVLRASQPRALLFMCKSNSARSQMAEGLARRLAPPGVRILSAGSLPSKLDPLAVEAMAEIGIDISEHGSKGVDEIPASEVEALVTLCSEETCPTLPGLRMQLHWPLPDPVSVRGDEEQRLQAFRGARDVLLTRLAVMFRGWRVSRDG